MDHMYLGNTATDLTTIQAPSPIEDRRYIPDLDAVRSPSPIQTRPFIPDLDNIRSPSPIEDRPLLPDLDIRPLSPIQDRPFIPDLNTVRSPSPIHNRQYIPDLQAIRSPSPILDRPFIPDLDNIRSPSPIQSRSYIQDSDNVWSSTQDHPFVPDLDIIRSPSPIETRRYIPDLEAVRSPSPIQDRPFVPDLDIVRSPTPIQDRLLIHEFKFLSLERRSPTPHSSSSGSYSPQVGGPDLSEQKDRTARLALMMDELDLFFWSVSETKWFGPNVLPHWRMWAKSHKMTIKLIEDILDYPNRYPELFKMGVIPRCGLPQDNEGRYILPALDVNEEDINPYLKVGVMENESIVVPGRHIPGLPGEPEEEYRMVDQLDDIFYKWDRFQAAVRQSDLIEGYNRERYVLGWQAHLLGCAGVPELAMMEARRIKPGLTTSYFEAPYPDIPPHPRTDLRYSNSELHDTEKLIANMTELSEAIGDLRKCTSDVFGATRLSNNATGL